MHLTRPGCGFPTLTLLGWLLLSSVASHGAAGGESAAGPLDIERRVAHGFATNNGVRLHTASLGAGPLVVMIHGFPDCWLTWRHSMAELSKTHRVVAMDLRGYNLSDRPPGDAAYDMQVLVEDVASVVRSQGAERAIVVGHDWGGAIAWTFAMTKPEMTERLVVLNLPHPRGLLRELARNPEQQRNSEYARNFQKPGAHATLTATNLAFWVKDAAAKPRYVEAFGRSDFDAMLAYYRRNYPREPYRDDGAPTAKVRCPVLLIHGLEDKALLHPALNGTWEWVEKDLTLLTVPGADHWVHQDAPELVTRTMVGWLTR
ncbi:MAG: alpha/beta hydrolase [Verrucomicrobiales bacterium]|nr:alpha/beta hydrolase [Verrucomicrobiales bacterium]